MKKEKRIQQKRKGAIEEQVKRVTFSEKSPHVRPNTSGIELLNKCPFSSQLCLAGSQLSIKEVIKWREERREMRGGRGKGRGERGEGYFKLSKVCLAAA